ncbi:MAG: DUF3108 domain-containing protein [Hydrogenophaga sp.]|jgi:hypothetical protein|nr:DUF3108 domain-containing protein [Hydrogenophaga sp.]
MPPPEQALARRRALLWLSAAVLAVHVGLLSGGWPDWRNSISPSGTSPTDTGAPSATRPLAPVGTPGAVVDTGTHAMPVTISSVRWIVPAPAPLQAPVAAPLPDTPRPAISPKPGSGLAAAEPRPAPADEAHLSASAPSAPAPSAPDPSSAASIPDEPPGVQADSQSPLLDSPPSEGVPAPATDPATDLDAVVVAAAAPNTSPAAPPPAARASSLPPAQPPGPADLRYDIDGRAKGLRYSADAHLRWQPSGNRYSAELEISAFLVGNRVQTSRGRLEAQGLAPERFGDRRRSNEKATHFDSASQRIRYSSNAPDTPLLPGAQDRLSVFLQLAALFQARPDAYAAGQTLRLQVAGTGDADTWSFLVGAEETLALPAGSMTARRLTRPPRGEHDSTVDIWLAPGMQFLPVRIRITEPNGDMADQRLRQRLP